MVNLLLRISWVIVISNQIWVLKREKEFEERERECGAFGSGMVSLHIGKFIIQTSLCSAWLRTHSSYKALGKPLGQTDSSKNII